MKITKYEHACLVVEEQGKRLIIDPGVYTTSLPELENVEAIVVTHVHQDHLDAEKLKAILKINPSAQVYTVQAVADEIKDSIPVAVVTGGNSVSVGVFTLDFYGGQHAIIHPTYPATDNVGVMVNKTLYYPGDSFSKPDQLVQILAIPSHAPWLKVSEAIDFISDSKPNKVFPTHNGFLNENGQALHNRLLSGATESAGALYTYLEPGMTIDV